MSGRGYWVSSGISLALCSSLVPAPLTPESSVGYAHLSKYLAAGAAGAVAASRNGLPLFYGTKLPSFERRGLPINFSSLSMMFEPGLPLDPWQLMSNYRGCPGVAHLLNILAPWGGAGGQPGRGPGYPNMNASK